MSFEASVFSRILKVISRRSFEDCVSRYSGNVYVKKYSCWQQLCSMMYFHLSSCRSLRDLVTCFNSHSNHFYHLGSDKVSRSTISDANSRRDYRIYRDLFYTLLQQYRHQLNKGKELNEMLRLIDSSKISFAKALHNYGEQKGSKSGVKLHLVYDANEGIPTYFSISESRRRDIFGIRNFIITPGSTYVFDRGYVSYKWWKHLDDNNCTFITRTNVNIRYRTIKALPTKGCKEVLDDAIVTLNSADGKKQYPGSRLRLIKFKKEDGVVLHFITNNMDKTAQEIANLYKKRWDIELFFKWVKQNLKIKKVIAKNENAIKIQIVTAMIAYMLIRINMLNFPIKLDPHTFLNIVKANLMQTKNIVEIIIPPPKIIKKYDQNQMQFNFGRAL